MIHPMTQSAHVAPPMLHRSRWQTLFGRYLVTLVSQPIGKQPRLLGATKDRLVVVELTGHPRSLTAVTVVAAMLPTALKSARRNGQLLDEVAAALGAPLLWIADSLRAIHAANEAARASGEPFVHPDIHLDIGMVLVSLHYAPETRIVTLKAVSHAPVA